jgi:Protein of unknown function (DUF3303)
MLMHVVWEFIDVSEEASRRSLAVFQAWKPPEGADFKGFYGFADGDGGVAIVEVDSAATLARTVAPFTPWLRFTGRPIHPIEESAAIAGEGIAFRDGIG